MSPSSSRSHSTDASQQDAARLATLIQNLSAGTVVEDERRRIALANQAFCDIFAIPVPPAALVGADCAESAQAVKHLFRDPEGFIERTARVLARLEPMHGEELELVDGRILERDYAPVQLGAALLGHLWTYRDVTRERRARAALAASEAMLRGIVESALDCIITIDTEGLVREFSPAAERTFGYARADVLGRPLHELIIPARYGAAHREGLRRYLATGEGPVLHRRVELTAVTAAGAEFPVEIAITPVRLADGRQLFTAFLRDITARKRAEAELQQARVEAERSAAAKEQFLANVSHELRTPLNAIVGLAHLLENHPSDADASGSLGGIRFAADTLLAVVNDLLDYSRVQSGRMAFEAVPFLLRPLLEGVVGSCRANAVARGLSLTLDAAEDLPAAVTGDPGRLSQVLLNLVGNAIKFTAQGGVTLRAHRAPASRDPSLLGLQFSVSDTGIGIAEADLARVFEPFEQASAATTRRFGGSGLGLAIVRELVERQGGTVGVESVVGRGSTFTVTLPFREAREASPAHGAGERPATLGGACVLLVEDNEMNRVIASRILREAGAEVVTAADGREAVERVRVQPFDAVLMDIQMPVMDGYEATWRIRHELGIAAERLPIIALTATALSEDQRRAEAAGMTDVVLKPFRPDHLCARIARALAGPREPRAGAQRSIDRRLLAEHTAGLPDLARDLIRIFMDTVPPGLERLARMAALGDRAATAALAHQLKAQAGTVGATTLEQALALVEACARAPDTSAAELESLAAGATRLAPEVIEELRAIGREYEPITANGAW